MPYTNFYGFVCTPYVTLTYGRSMAHRFDCGKVQIQTLLIDSIMPSLCTLNIWWSTNSIYYFIQAPCYNH